MTSRPIAFIVRSRCSPSRCPSWRVPLRPLGQDQRHAVERQRCSGELRYRRRRVQRAQYSGGLSPRRASCVEQPGPMSSGGVSAGRGAARRCRHRCSEPISRWVITSAPRAAWTASTMSSVVCPLDAGTCSTDAAIRCGEPNMPVGCQLGAAELVNGRAGVRRGVPGGRQLARATASSAAAEHCRRLSSSARPTA